VLLRTVDLISYTISKLNPSPELDESALGSGGLCGSTFLDRSFDNWLTDKFHTCSKWTDVFHLDAMHHWESNTKRNFAGDMTKKYFIPCRGMSPDESLGIKGGKLEMSGAEIKRIFDPVISRILNLVKRQMTETEKKSKVVKAVLLAGGFGSNEYLKRRIQEEIGSKVGVHRMKNWYVSCLRQGVKLKSDTSQQHCHCARRINKCSSTQLQTKRRRSTNNCEITNCSEALRDSSIQTV
jgi:hypothetical protein